MALNLRASPQSQSDIENIQDEYRFTVTEDTKKHREKRIIRISEALKNDDQTIPLCTTIMQALKVVFSQSLCDMEKNSLRNKNETLDTIVALNAGQTPTWERIREDYGARHAMFVLLDGLASADTYKHAAISIVPNNGRIVFLVSRDSEECTKSGDLGWIRDTFKTTGITVVKLPISLIEKIIRKLRNPQKHDESERALSSLLTAYERHYLKNITPPKDVTRTKQKTESTTEVSQESSRCFGELRTTISGEYFLDIYELRLYGAGQYTRLASVSLVPQPNSLLHYALENAIREFTFNAVESAKGSGQYKDKSECQPPDAKTFVLSWTLEELQEKLLDKKKPYSESETKPKPKPKPKLSRDERGRINTAISRIRKLVRFSDGVELINLNNDTGERHTTIPFRRCRRTVD